MSCFVCFKNDSSFITLLSSNSKVDRAFQHLLDPIQTSYKLAYDQFNSVQLYLSQEVPFYSAACRQNQQIHKRSVGKEKGKLLTGLWS